MTSTVAEPAPASVRDRHGLWCPRASGDSYPLDALCLHCGRLIAAADGQAPWLHERTGQARCQGRHECSSLVCNPTPRPDWSHR